MLEPPRAAGEGKDMFDSNVAALISVVATVIGAAGTVFAALFAWRVSEAAQELEKRTRVDHLSTIFSLLGAQYLVATRTREILGTLDQFVALVAACIRKDTKAVIPRLAVLRALPESERIWLPEGELASHVQCMYGHGEDAVAIGSASAYVKEVRGLYESARDLLDECSKSQTKLLEIATSAGDVFVLKGKGGEEKKRRLFAHIRSIAEAEKMVERFESELRIDWDAMAALLDRVNDPLIAYLNAMQELEEIVARNSILQSTGFADFFKDAKSREANVA